MLKPLAKWAPLVLRVVLGVTLIMASLAPYKIFNPSLFVETVRSMAGNYLPEFFIVVYGYTIPYLELITGIFLVLGLFTRLTAVVVSLMFVSFIIAIAVASPDVPLFLDPIGKTIPNKDFAYLAMAVALALTGGGAWAVDQKMR